MRLGGVYCAVPLPFASMTGNPTHRSERAFAFKAADNAKNVEFKELAEIDESR
jgi:hypothetical protein